MIGYFLENFESKSNESILAEMKSYECNNIFVEKTYNYLNCTALKSLIKNTADGDTLLVPSDMHITLLQLHQPSLCEELCRKKLRVISLYSLRVSSRGQSVRTCLNDCYNSKKAEERFNLLLYEGVTFKVHRDYRFCSPACIRKLVFLSLQEVGAPWSVLKTMRYCSTDKKEFIAWVEKGYPRLPRRYREILERDHFDGRGCVEMDEFPQTKEETNLP